MGFPPKHYYGKKIPLPIIYSIQPLTFFLPVSVSLLAKMQPPIPPPTIITSWPPSAPAAMMRAVPPLGVLVVVAAARGLDSRGLNGLKACKGSGTKAQALFIATAAAASRKNLIADP